MNQIYNNVGCYAVFIKLIVVSVGFVQGFQDFFVTFSVLIQCGPIFSLQIERSTLFHSLAVALAAFAKCDALNAYYYYYFPPVCLSSVAAYQVSRAVLPVVYFSCLFLCAGSHNGIDSNCNTRSSQRHLSLSEPEKPSADLYWI